MPKGDVAPLIGLIALLIVGGFILRIVVQFLTKIKAIRARTEIHNRLVDKFGSAPEFFQFLQTEGGQSFLESVTVEQSTAAERILSSIQKGILLTLLGLGLLLLGILLAGRIGEGQTPLYILGVIAVSLGVGFLVSAGISFRLSKAWGLVAPTEAGKR